MKTYVITISLIFMSMITIAQSIGINTNSPDASAVLDVKSQDKGLLIPRMTSTSRNSISNPANGLLVYDSNENGFYYYKINQWIKISNTKEISDADSDTYITVEKTADEDQIKFYTKGYEMAKLDGKTLHLGSPDGSLFIGKNAGLHDNGIDHQSVGIGYEALMNDSTGWNNTAVGYRSLSAKNAGDNNTAVGAYSMHKTQYGDFNSSFGQGSMFENNAGAKNVAFGHRSMFLNVSGSSNVAVGYESLRSLQTGDYNIAIGDHSLFLTNNTFNNIAIGASSGESLNGNNNIFLGSEAGSNSIGNNNIFIGNSVGNNAIGDSILMIDIENNSDPLIWGDFSANALQFNGSVNINNKYTFPTTAGANGQHLKLNNSGKLIWATDGDQSNTNEFQVLTLDGQELKISSGNTVTLPTPVSYWTAIDSQTIFSTHDIGLGINNPEARLHVTNNEEKGIIMHHLGSNNGPDIGLNMVVEQSNAPYKSGFQVLVDGSNSGTAVGVKSTIIPTISGPARAIEGLALGRATAIYGKALNPSGIAAHLNGKTEILGQTSIGTIDTLGQLHVHSNTSNHLRTYFTPQNSSSEGSSSIILSEDDDATHNMELKYDGVANTIQVLGNSNFVTYGPHLEIKRNTGDVAIGGAFANGYKLSVDGNIICEDLVIENSNNWPDYVFDENYNLVSLREVEKFIQANGHLSKFEPAICYEESGFSLGDTQRLLLEKVEELTLYLIDLNKKYDKLEAGYKELLNAKN